MVSADIEKIRNIDNFESLVKFLREELNWDLPSDQIIDMDDLVYIYEPEELGLADDVAKHVNSIKQLRPFSYNQPWGIFYVEFEPKRLPMVAMRSLLQRLQIKKRPSGSSSMRLWDMKDLLFINTYGSDDEKAINFAHFTTEDAQSLPTLKVITWKTSDPPLHLERCFSELQNLKYDQDMTVDQWRENWVKGFVLQHRHTITTSKALAKTLANLAQDIRSNAQERFESEKTDGPFHKTMAKFKKALIHDLTEEDFADMYAQTIAYGLLYTAIRGHTKGEPNQVSAERAKDLVLPTNPFLKEVFEDFFDIGSRKWSTEQEKITGVEFDALGVNEIVATLKDQRTDFDAVLRDFNSKNRNEDPVIHFYELFLKEYNTVLRKSRGVYYTPQPVVSFIVRSVDEVLKRDFKLPLGLADTTTWGQMHKQNPDIKIPEGVSKNDFFVQILDPATGTGTFLVEVINTIAITMKTKWGKELGLSVPSNPNDIIAWKNDPQVLKRWNDYVPNCLLPRLNGFELMMAPYAIAHMKIGIKLYETGYKNFEQDKKRVQVYLTNTLEEAIDTSGYLDTLDPALALETKQANILKQKNSITVVIGNPPYAGHSFNASKIKTYVEPGQPYQTWSKKHSRFITKKAGHKGVTQEKLTWIGKLIQPYFYVDVQPLGEKNPKWLNDDYVKFIRYGQYRMENSGAGVFGFITNHAYIDNPTFRGMRQSLINTYQQINIIDLHGNAKKRERCPDVSKDENVFQIQQGVAINISAKFPVEARICHSHIWGTTGAKHEVCKQNIVSSLSNTTKLTPTSDMYLLCPQDSNVRLEYEAYSKITEIMKSSSLGIATARDRFSIALSHEEMWQRVNDFIGLGVEDARSKYCLGDDVRDWKVAMAQEDVKATGPSESLIKPILYRPWDRRFTYYTGRSRGFLCMPRNEIMRHMLSPNVGLSTTRNVEIGRGWEHVFCSRYLTQLHTVSIKEVNYLFPLYLYPDTGDLFEGVGGGWEPGMYGRVPNLDKRFVESFSRHVGLRFVSDGSSDSKMTFCAEDVLHYIYAILHSHEYRLRYSEFLKRDFPRVPVTSNLELLRELCAFGKDLVSFHLKESAKLENHVTTFPVSGSNDVAKVGEKGKALADLKDGKGRLFINRTQYFDGIPEGVWNFHIGGYQVCHKWLYDRKKAGRKLSVEDIEHYHKIVVAINETIKIMNQIDEVIEAHSGWPIK